MTKRTKDVLYRTVVEYRNSQTGETGYFRLRSYESTAPAKTFGTRFLRHYGWKEGDDYRPQNFYSELMQSYQPFDYVDHWVEMTDTWVRI